MKKTIVLISIIVASVFATAINAHAQEGLQLGVQVTPQFSWLMNQDDTDNPDYKNITTLTGAFGIGGQYGFSDNHGIGLDVMYSFQGQRYNLSGVERFKRVDYVKIPLMYVYSYSFTDKVMFIGKIGPQIGILSNAKLTDKDGNDILSDQKKVYQNTTYGGMIAAGIALKLRDNLLLNALLRYDYNISNDENNNYNAHINKPDGGFPPSNRADTHNVTAGLTIGITYLCGSKK